MDDIVERLRAAAKSGDLALGQSFDCMAVADEIERLRAAGDALAAHLADRIPAHWSMTSYMVLGAWREARRG